MNMIDLSEYRIKEIIQQHDWEHDDIIAYLQDIIMDRSIPEASKQDVRKQLDEVIRIKSITMPMPTIVLEKKEG